MRPPRRIDPAADDMRALQELILRAFAFMDGRIDPPSSAHALTPASLQAKAATEYGLVIEEDGRPVACLFCRPEGAGTLYLGKLAVEPGRQGKGLGKALLTEAEALARSMGCLSLRLETRVELVENHRVFSRWGFVVAGESRHPGFDRTTSIDMVKSLRSNA